MSTRTAEDRRNQRAAPLRSDSDRARRAGALIQDEELSKAGRELAEDLSIAPTTADNVERWRALHPSSRWAQSAGGQRLLQELRSNQRWPHRDAEDPSPATPPPTPPNNRPAGLDGRAGTTATVPDECETCLPPPAQLDDPEIAKNAQAIVTAARKLKVRTHAGPFGWSASLLRAGMPLTYAAEPPDGERAVVPTPLALLIMAWGEGLSPQWFVDHVFRVSLAIILAKPNGGLRPVGVGFGGRRLYSTYMNRTYATDIRNSMPTAQYGLDTKGSEAVVHLLRNRLPQDDPDDLRDDLATAPCCFQADETNAFNRADRTLFLQLAQAHWPPPLYEYVSRLYARPNKLVLGSVSIEATDGSTQGCVLGGALYNLTTAPAIFQSEAVMADVEARQVRPPPQRAAVAAYADDAATVGGLEAAYHGMRTYVTEGLRAGKLFNASKCTFHTPSRITYTRLVSAAQAAEGLTAGDTTLQLGVTDGEAHIVVHNTTFRILPPDGIVSLGAPVGTDQHVRDVLTADWEKRHAPMLRRIRLMADVQSAMVALRVLATSKVTYLLRTVPPSQVAPLAQQWDEATEQTLAALTSSSYPVPPHARALWNLKAHDGGTGVPHLATLSPIAYQASVAGVVCRLAPLSGAFAAAYDTMCSVPPLKTNDRGQSTQSVAALIAAREAAHPPTSATPPPALQVLRVWRDCMRLPDAGLLRLFVPHAASLPEELAAVRLVNAAPDAKFQRELGRQASRDARASYTADLEERLRTLRLQKRHGTPEGVDAVRDYKHAAATSWRAFHLLQPWLPYCRVDGEDFAAVLRFQLRLERQHLPPHFTCLCRNKQQPARVITSPSYHAFTCGFGARSRKRTHNHVCTLLTKAINDAGRLIATEVPRPEAGHGGYVPDINLALNPASLLPSPTGPARGAAHIDVTIVAPVQASAYTAALDRMKTSDPKKDRYDLKLDKHGPADRPVVLDLAGGCEPRTAAFLKEAFAAKPGRLSLFYQQAAAALARLIGGLDQRTRRARLVQSGSVDGRCHDTEDDDAAAAAALEEERQDRRLDDSFPPGGGGTCDESFLLSL